MLNAKPKNSITEEEVFFNKNIKGKLFYCNLGYVEFKNTTTLIFNDNGTFECKQLFENPLFWKSKGKSYIDKKGIKIFDTDGSFCGHIKFKFDEDYTEDNIKSSRFYTVIPNNDYFYYKPEYGDGRFVSISKTEKEYNERQIKAEEKYINSFIGSWQNSEESFKIKNIAIKKDEEGKLVIRINELHNDTTSFIESFTLDYKYNNSGYFIGVYSTSGKNLYDEMYFYITKVYLNIENGNLILQADFASNRGTELDPNSAVKGYEKIVLYNVSKYVEDAFK